MLGSVGKTLKKIKKQKQSHHQKRSTTFDFRSVLCLHSASYGSQIRPPHIYLCSCYSLDVNRCCKSSCAPCLEETGVRTQALLLQSCAAVIFPWQYFTAGREGLKALNRSELLILASTHTSLKRKPPVRSELPPAVHKLCLQGENKQWWTMSVRVHILSVESGLD